MRTVYQAHLGKISKLAEKLMKLHQELNDLQERPYWWCQGTIAYRKWTRIMDSLARIRDKMELATEEYRRSR